MSVEIHLICISSSPIQFADALLESGYLECVKVRWRSHIARSHIFSGVVMSEGIKGMSPAISLDDSEEIVKSKMIQSDYPFACRKLCVFARLLRAWTVIIIPDTRRCRDLPDPFLAENLDH